MVFNKRKKYNVYKITYIIYYQYTSPLEMLQFILNFNIAKTIVGEVEGW